MGLRFTPDDPIYEWNRLSGFIGFYPLMFYYCGNVLWCTVSVLGSANQIKCLVTNSILLTCCRTPHFMKFQQQSFVLLWTFCCCFFLGGRGENWLYFDTILFNLTAKIIFNLHFIFTFLYMLLQFSTPRAEIKKKMFCSSLQFIIHKLSKK